MKHFFPLLAALLLTASTFAQVGINTENPDASAALDITSTTKGLLIPRMTTAQRLAIASPVAGLMIYQTDVTAGFYYYNGSSWAKVAACGLSIGDTYQGGIIFYLDATGCYGLIAAASDQSSGIRWDGGSYTNTRARADGIGAGLKNTAIIIANQGPVDGEPFAATVCNEYTVTVGGFTYGDWYLPSKYELKLLYLERATVGNFTNNDYWSSTENATNTAWRMDFNDGTQPNNGKNNTSNVRAVRAF